MSPASPFDVAKVQSLFHRTTFTRDMHNLTNAQIVNVVRQIRRGRAMGNVHFFRHTLPRTLYKNSKWWF